MRGKEVFYPMGWDDNGLPTERRVENYYGVLCDPTVPYDAGFEPPEQPAKNRADFVRISRPNFIELCERLLVIDEQAFEATWRHLGLSVDWSMTYTTIERALPAHLPAGLPAQPGPRRGLLHRGAVPVGRHLPDRGRPGGARGPGAPRRLPPARLPARRHRDGDRGEPVPTSLIDTTRPELVVSCVALVAHPDDERYQPLFGSTVTTPVFGVEVPGAGPRARRARQGHAASP